MNVKTGVSWTVGLLGYGSSVTFLEDSYDLGAGP